jgi:hypothetical protein
MQKVILAKKEGVYATDAAPTPAANAILTRNFQRPEPILTDTLDRNLDLPTRGRVKSANTNRRTACSFEVELAGSGAAGTAAPWMELLEACGMAAPVLTAATRAEQKFAAEGAALSSLTQHDWLGDQRVRGLGQRGTFGFDFTAGAYGFLKFDFQGLLPPPPAVDGVAPGGAPDFSRWKDPLEVNTENTDFLLDGFAMVLKAFTGDANAEVKARNLVGANYIQRGNHAMTVRIVGEAPAIGAKNYFTSLDNGAEIAVQLVHGIGAGKVVQIDANYLQILKISRSEEDDKLMVDITAGLNIRNGQDDFLITAK